MAQTARECHLMPAGGDYLERLMSDRGLLGQGSLGSTVLADFCLLVGSVV